MSRRPVRRGQLISPFGVGAITDFRNDEALMCAGLDAWFPNGAPPSECLLREERLQRKLGCARFVRPPSYSPDGGRNNLTVPYIRFPLWHYCPRCFRMKKTSLHGPQPKCDHGVPQGKPVRTIPSRIVAVCEDGHIQDFPYRAWIGCKCASDQEAELYFKAGRSAATLAGAKIECAKCDAKRSLAGAFEPNILAKAQAQCSGDRPWLGETESTDTCTCRLEAMQRGASNVYFALTASSIYIPPAGGDPDPDVIKAVEAFWDFVSAGTVNGEPNRAICNVIAQKAYVDPEQVFNAVKAKLGAAADGQVDVSTEEEYRRQEFSVLSAGSNNPRSELYCETISGAEFGRLFRYVRKVGLVRKLRETRVLVGLSRINPKVDRNDRSVQPLARQAFDWLPAVDVRGEGIFIEFHDEPLMEWSALAAPRIQPLVQTFNSRRLGRGLRPRPIDGRFMAIHTLAHVLVKELTFACGYGSASLRERVYCNLEQPDQPMNGILIYTASGDAEGSLGGLVGQGVPGKLEKLFGDALRRAEWCSNDPVCMESPGRGQDIPNLAACHACCLLPETSCEEGNKLLDRALLVGTLNDKGIGYFSSSDADEPTAR